MTIRSKLPAAAGLGAVLLMLGAGAPEDPPSTGGATVLAIVNGDPVTSADLDEELVRFHREMSTAQRLEYDYRELLERLIHDRLILQQAVSLGLDEEPAVREPIERNRIDNAVEKYVAATYAGPDSITTKAVREFFDENYWKIGVRQISARTRESIVELRDAIRRGASMDSLARAVSVDSHRYRGGLHNLKVWADVTNVIREAVADLDVGELSEPFPYREAWSLVRVEERLPVDEAELERYEGEIRKYLRGAERERAWRVWVQEHLERTPVDVDSTVVEAIAADSARTLTPEFVVLSDRPVLSIGDTHVTEYELRKTLSHKAMRGAQESFSSHLEATLEAEKADLALRVAAAEAGWLDAAEVVDTYRKELERRLIEAYLSETVVSRIRFNRDEFREYWEQNPEEFPAPPQVQVGTIMVGTREEADEIKARLQEGADFEYLRSQYAPSGHDAVESNKWVSPGIFSEEIRDELLRIDVGEASGPYEVAGGSWFILKLKKRRMGEVKPLEECELQLREIMFERKFKTLLDEHLALLKERSEIELHEAAIDEYFGS